MSRGLGDVYKRQLYIILKPLDTVIEIPCQGQCNNEHRTKCDVQFSTETCLPGSHFRIETLVPSSIQLKDTKQNTTTIEWVA